jgi:hypothetical protein
MPLPPQVGPGVGVDLGQVKAVVAGLELLGDNPPVSQVVR